MRAPARSLRLPLLFVATVTAGCTAEIGDPVGGEAGRLTDDPIGQDPGPGMDPTGLEGEAEGEIPRDPPGVDPAARFFDLQELPAFAIDLPPESIAALGVDSRSYVPGTFHYLGETYENVGVRLKGQWGSFRDLSGKAGFKVKFDEYTPGREFHGISRLTLNNMVQDPTMHAEVLGYAMFRAAGVPAPRVGYAQVTMNGAPYGLYALIETKDDEWVRRNFADPGGNLYEAAYYQDIATENVGLFELDVAGMPADRSDVTSLVNAVRGSADTDFLLAMRQAIEWEAFLRFTAIEVLIDHWDGYAAPPLVNNYHFYREPSTGRFTFTPHGIDQTFNTFTDPHVFLGTIMIRCNAIPACRQQYDATLLEMTALFESLDLIGLSISAEAHIRNAALADPRKPYSNADWEASLLRVRNFIRDRPANLRMWLGAAPPAP